MKKGLDRNGIEAVQFPMRTIAESDPSAAPEQGAGAFRFNAARDLPEGFLHEAVQFAEGFKLPHRDTIANDRKVNSQPVPMKAIHCAGRPRFNEGALLTFRPIARSNTDLGVRLEDLNPACRQTDSRGKHGMDVRQVDKIIEPQSVVSLT